MGGRKLTLSKMTIIEDLLDNQDLLHGMLAMPDSMNRQMAFKRRRKLFEFLWELTNLEETEVLNMVNKRELEFIKEHGDKGVPEWLLRMEAQDIVLEVMHERFEEEGLL